MRIIIIKIIKQQHHELNIKLFRHYQICSIENAEKVISEKNHIIRLSITRMIFNKNSVQ